MTAPVAPQQRIDSLDVLRGFALLGILLMNIQSYSMISPAYNNPTAYGDLTGANGWVWFLSHTLTSRKMMAIFSMLFGAGILLFATRIEARGERPAPVHYRRMGWLILFGVLHGALLWHGDVLFIYGVCGLIVYPFRRMRPRMLLPLGLLIIAVHTAIAAYAGSLPENVFLDGWQPPRAAVDWELWTYQGGWLHQMELRLPRTAGHESFFLMMFGLWRAGGLMLVGMGLYKLGVLSGERSARFYWALVAVALLVGLPVVLYGIHWNFSTGWSVKSLFYGSQFNYWGGLLVSLGYLGLLMLVGERGMLAGLTTRLAAVGRLAFSNYILQTLICTTIFYGHGFGLFGEVSRVGQMLIVFSIWGIQLIVSPVWVQHFRFGPLEWLWRSLTYARLQPFRVLAPAGPDQRISPHDTIVEPASARAGLGQAPEHEAAAAGVASRDSAELARTATTKIPSRRITRRHGPILAPLVGIVLLLVCWAVLLARLTNTNPRSLAVDAEHTWPWVELSADQLAMYEGDYEEAWFQRPKAHPIRIWLADGMLRTETGWGFDAAMVPMGEHRFAWGRFSDGELVEIIWPKQVQVFEVEQGRVVGYKVFDKDREIVSAIRIEP